jgi:hypothetical protein
MRPENISGDVARSIVFTSESPLILFVSSGLCAGQHSWLLEIVCSLQVVSLRFTPYGRATVSCWGYHDGVVDIRILVPFQSCTALVLLVVTLAGARRSFNIPRSTI